MFNLLVTDRLDQAGITYLEADPEIELLVRHEFDPAAMAAELGEIDAWIVDRDTLVDGPLLDKMGRLRVIGRAGSRVRHIDLDAVTRRGILLLNLPDGMAVSMAEHTLALMLAASRQIPQAHRDMSAGLFEIDPQWYAVRDLRRKCLGLVGFNEVAKLLVELVRPFDLDVLVYEPKLSEQVALDYRITLVDLEDLFAQAEIISLHCEVTPETTQIIDQEGLANMRPGGLLINTTSPRLINANALAEALSSGQVRVAAMDGALTFGDGIEADAPPNLIQTPELAIWSKEGRAAVSFEIARNVLDALKGINVRDALNLIVPAGLPFAKIEAYAELGRKIGSLQAQLCDGKIDKVEVEVSGEALQEMVRPIGAGILQGMLRQILGSQTGQRINDVNAPLLANKEGIQISQVYNLSSGDYTNLVSCRVRWHQAGESGERLISGVLFDEKEPRIVTVDGYRLEAKPDRFVLMMRNQDVPGVIGQVATLLATYQVNIAEWRLGRLQKGGEALSFINLDGEPPSPVIDALAQAPAVNFVRLVYL